MTKAMRAHLATIDPLVRDPQALQCNWLGSADRHDHLTPDMSNDLGFISQFSSHSHQAVIVIYALP